MTCGYVGANKNGACRLPPVKLFSRRQRRRESLECERMFFRRLRGRQTDDVFGHPTITPHDHVLGLTISCLPLFCFAFWGRNRDVRCSVWEHGCVVGRDQARVEVLLCTMMIGMG
ncbi:hypothetical protein K440DRAFT_327106 [Wilcoxina mikolae CBS 423.85]|nr:hypothetical protein K440DRAFT_327106 [Wilcoxina mikolae CBS 423.85]